MRMYVYIWVCAFDRRLKKVGDYDQYDQWGLVLQDFIKYIRQKEPYTNGGWKLKIPHRSSIQMFQAATHICQFTIEMFRISVIFWVVVGRITISKSKLKHSQEEISLKFLLSTQKNRHALHIACFWPFALEGRKAACPPQKKQTKTSPSTSWKTTISNLSHPPVPSSTSLGTILVVNLNHSCSFATCDDAGLQLAKDWKKTPSSPSGRPG